MEKLEKPKKKHDHLLTKLLKFSIFAFVMLAPLLSVISKVAYVSFNKNAKESYYGETINETIINNVYSNQLVNGKIYTLNLMPLTDINQSNIANGSNSYVCTLLESNVDSLSQYYNTQVNFYIYRNPSDVGVNLNYSFYIYSGNTRVYAAYNQPTPIIWIKFNLISYYNNANLQINYFSETLYNKYSYLDNAMSYGINELQNDNLYNWSKNTGIYNAILGMTNGLGANNTLAMLLAYWSIITAIYIVFDIIIEIFIKLTHLLN